MGEHGLVGEQRAQRACYAASSICLLGGLLLGSVGVVMILVGLYTTDKLEDEVWSVSLLIVGASFLIILFGSLGCACACSRQMLLSREQSIIKCIAFHAGMSEMPDGSLPPCCSRNSATMRVWSTVNPHSRMAWNSDLPGQPEIEEEKKEEEEEKKDEEEAE